MVARFLAALAILGAFNLIACSAANASLITTSASGNVMFEYLGGEAGPSLQEFGIGTPATDSFPSDRNSVLVIDYYHSPVPLPVVNKGYFLQGSQFDFYNLSNYNGNLFAFSSRLSNSPTQADQTAFTDSDNSLHLGGSVVERIGDNAWILHLDDAWSFMYDDDDNEMIIKVWVDQSVTPPVSIPEPTSWLLFSLALACLVMSRLSEFTLSVRPRFLSCSQYY